MVNGKVPFDSVKAKNILKLKSIKVNDTEIQVKQYLPVQEKLTIATNVLQALAGNKYSFVNPIQLDVYSTLEIVKAYTNIDFDAGVGVDEDPSPAALYDALEADDLANKIISAIPANEYKFVMEGIEESVNAYYKYQNSVLGILEAVTQDYSNLNLDATELQKKIGDPANLGLLKGIMEKLG